MNQSKKILITLLFLVTFIGSTFAQQEKFNEGIAQLTENIKTVSTAKITYEQELKVVLPGVVQLSITEIDLKGNRTNFIFEFNLADIDPIMVREITEKDKMFVQLIVEGNQDLITVYENGELDSYEQRISIYSKDIDNARNIKESVKELIAVSEEIMEQKFNFNSYKEKVAWLTENVKTTIVNETSYQQVLQKDENIPGKFSLEVIESTEKDTEAKKFEFNIADINPNTIKFDIKGSAFYVVFEMNGRRKLIKCFEEGKLSNYEYKLAIVGFNIENAKDIKYVLQNSISDAEEKLKATFPALDDVNKATQLLSENIMKVVIDDHTYTQSIEDRCITTLEVIEDDMKSQDEMKYIFNLSDLNYSSVNYDIKGDEIVFSFKTKGGDKLIKVFENQEQQNYESDAKFMCYDVENARMLSYLMQGAIKLCEENVIRMVPETTLEDKLNWLIENITEVTVEDKTYTQTIEIIEDLNKLKFILKEIKDQDIKEYIYEFNLSDINPNTVKYDISGKELSISISTNYNSKVIKTYEDGEIKNYENQINIYVPDIEIARNIILALKECIKANEN